MPDQQATLTPASGTGLGKVLFEALLGNPDFLPSMVAAAMGGLTAVYARRWDKHSDDWGDPEPDHKTRVQTFLALWAQAEGEPIKRMVHQHLGAAGALDPEAMLASSPAARDAMRAMIERIESKTGREPKRAAEPLEVG